MPVFIERFVLPILSAIIVVVILLNPFKWDSRQRFSLLIAAIAFAYFCAHSSYRKTQAPQNTGATTPAVLPAAPQGLPVPPAGNVTGNVTTNGPNSPVVSGNGNSVSIPDQSKSQLNEPKKKE
jgi:hypothetical protein